MTIEEQLFDVNGGWDGDLECGIFYDCVTIVKIGDFAIGSKFDCVTIIHSKSEIEFYNNDKIVAKFELSYLIGEPLPLP